MTIETSGSKRSIALGRISLIILGADVLGILLLPLAIATTKGPFLSVLQESEVVLPSVTQFLVSIPQNIYFLSSFGIVFPLVIKEFLISSKKIKLTINIATLVAASAFVCVYVMAFLVPMMNLVVKLETNP